MTDCFVWHSSALPRHSSHVHYRVQRSLELELLNHIMAYKDHASAPYIQLTSRRIHSPGFDDIVAEHDIESHYTLLAFTDTPIVSHMSFTLWICEN